MRPIIIHESLAISATILSQLYLGETKTMKNYLYFVVMLLGYLIVQKVSLSRNSSYALIETHFFIFLHAKVFQSRITNNYHSFNSYKQQDLGTF